MKLSMATTRLITMLCFTFFQCQSSMAQAPTITANVGIPTGNASSSGIAYGNGIYVAIVAGGKIYRSADGEAWIKVTDAGIPAGTFNSITFGTGVFVIVGNNGLILSSTNGQNWTSRTSGTSNNLFDVKFYQSTFFAVGLNTTLRTSADGSTWNTITIGTGTSSDMFLHITYGNSLFVITARTSGGGGSYIYRSSTGVSNSWTFQNLSIGTLNKVLYLNDRFFAFIAGHQVHTSTNGSTWTNVTATITLIQPDASPGTWNSSNQIFNGFYDGTKYHFFGSSEYYSGYGSVWTSTSGTNLTLLTKTAYIVPQGSAYLNGKYFQFGNEGIVSSSDGITYKYPSGSYNSLASNGTVYVGVGAVSQSGVIFTSPDFTTWTEKTPSGMKELYAVVYDGNKYLATGNQTVIESTDNGNTWTQVASAGEYLNALAFGASRFVVGGNDINTYAGKIAYSSDGTTWTTANTDNNYYLKIKYINNNFFAVGYSNDTYLGVILHSVDGTSWTDITPNLAYPVYYFNDVVYDGSKYHFMGMEYADPDNWIYDDFFSVSTSTLNDPNSFNNKGSIDSPPAANLGGDYGQGAFAYSNGRFVGSVNDINTGTLYIIYSTNGVNWTAEALNETVSVWSALAEGNRFRLLGMGDAKITVEFSGITLPVNISSFTTTLVNGESLLKWQTASEQNSNRFTVQYSTDASNWQHIGMVMAAGQSQSVLDYQFIHPYPQPGNNYYRLMQTDIDGREQISSVNKIVIGKSNNLKLYPNPAGQWAELRLPKAGPATVSLYNVSGQQVYQQLHTETIIRLSLHQLPKGMYQLVVNQNGERHAQPLYHH